MRLRFSLALVALAATSASAAPVDKRFLGKWHLPGQQEACQLGGLAIRPQTFDRCKIVTASTPEVNKYSDGGVTQYIAAECAGDDGASTTFFWLHLNSAREISYGKIGVGGRQIIRRCPRR